MTINSRNDQEFGLMRYALLYSEIKDELDKLKAQYPGFVTIRTMGQSNNGRDLYLVILSNDPDVDAFIQERQTIARNPRAAQKEASKHKLPILVNCNLHGNEISGTDGLMAFMKEFLASPDRDRYLQRLNFFISICLNPDSRAYGLHIYNGRGVDLNREWMAQTQPETRALIEHVLTKVFPVVMLDVHGYMGTANLLIDACTPPHNPLLEYDLLEHHIIENSKAMAASIKAKTGLDTDIPAIIWKDGWDDYSPVYTPQFCAMFGAVPHTLECNFPSEEGAVVAHYATKGILDYVQGKEDALFMNQCEIFARGIEGAPIKDITVPDYYLLPKTGQKDQGLLIHTINQLMFNAIDVYETDDTYVVPAAQPFRAALHNMLWQGEDMSHKIDNCYDISFYSYTVMRGLNVEETNSFDMTTSRQLTAPVAKKTAVSAAFTKLQISCETVDGVNLANTLAKAGHEVLRDKLTGHFVVEYAPVQKAVEAFCQGHCVKLSEYTAENPLEKVLLPKILVVGDSGNTAEVLCRLGFDADFLPFAELNLGYVIHPENYDVLFVGGTKLGLWHDPYDDSQGCALQVSWALRERGRKELLRAAAAFKGRVMHGFSGDKVAEHLQCLPYTATTPLADQKVTDSPESQSWMLSVPNGSFKVQLNDCPLCYGYQPEEVFYMVAPISIEETSAARAMHFAPQSFIHGFNKRKGEVDGKIAAIYQGRDVLLGFDPTFRGYLDKSYILAANAAYMAAGMGQ